MTTTPTDRDAEYDAETEMLDGVVTALEGALAEIDDPCCEMTPSEQLAALAVAGVRALVPVLRGELERRQA